MYERVISRSSGGSETSIRDVPNIVVVKGPRQMLRVIRKLGRHRSIDMRCISPTTYE